MKILTSICNFGMVMLFAMLAVATFPAFAAEEYYRIVDLRGKWKFEIGDEMRWAAPDFDDSQWDDLFVPSSWEDEGFPGYDGYAWYRKMFKLSLNTLPDVVYLEMGRIDDVDEVYLNGTLLGFKGEFPPHYRTAYHDYRRYLVPAGLLNLNGENVVAVRVYDEQLSGGIMEGRIGLYAEDFPMRMEVRLDGEWRIQTGDDYEWRLPAYNDSGWRNIYVPLFWEAQGLRDYDGYAWYRRTITIPERLRNKDLVLLLGKIDDLDETFVNGERIGRTGKSMIRSRPEIQGHEWQQFRAYEIPSELLNFGGTNLIAVRVYDGVYDGGIYEGPVGIVEGQAFRVWETTMRQQTKNVFWELFNKIFQKVE